MCHSYSEILAAASLNKKQSSVIPKLLLGTVDGYQGPEKLASSNPLTIFFGMASNFGGYFSWK